MSAAHPVRSTHIRTSPGPPAWDAELDRTFEGIVVCCDQLLGTHAKEQVRRRSEALSAAGVDLMLVIPEADHGLQAATSGMPGPGRCFVACRSPRGVSEMGTDGVGDPAADEGPQEDLLVWFLRHELARGVGPGLVLVIIAGGPDVLDQGALGAVTAVDLSDLSDRTAEMPGWLAILDAQIQRRASLRVPAIDEDPAWCVAVVSSKARRRVDEALLTVGDGHYGTRGSLEELPTGSEPLVAAAGVYEHESGLPRLLPGPLWALLKLSPWASGDEGHDRRVLDLRTGVLVREHLDEDGVRLRTVRFAALSRPGVMVLSAEGPEKKLRPGPPLRAPIEPHVAFDVDGGDPLLARTASRRGGGIVAAASQRHGSEGELRTLERIAAYVADPDSAPRAERALRALHTAQGAGASLLLREQRMAWAARWEDADIEVDGDPVVQLGVRLALFHLLTSVGGDGEAALGARGLSGHAYAGHVFWDADVFALPVLAAIHPAAARAMLQYRIARLPQARRRAEEAGHDGARFPWESADDGTEVTPPFVDWPGGGRIPVETRDRAEHIVADVAWAAWQYAAWTGDTAFLDGPGRDLLTEGARYWASRVRIDANGVGHLDGVVGPDEYHAPVDDNAFTNVMARWNLRRAAALVEGHEAHRWQEIADGLADGYDRSTGLYEQHVGFFDLEPLVIAELAPRPVAADMVFGRERTAGSQILKQADVLMLHHLVPEEVEPGSLAPNLAFYGPRTAHGSSLSPAIHAALLARAGQPEAGLEQLRLACRLDLDDLTGTTAGGLHTAACGGLWQAVVMGFAGIRPSADALTVDPVLPTAWRSLRVRLRHHGQRLRVTITQSETAVETDEPIRVRNPEGVVESLPPGRHVMDNRRR
jgi:trehalose/maltose hydrolase-like predicted phosphorylase